LYRYSTVSFEITFIFPFLLSVDFQQIFFESQLAQARTLRVAGSACTESFPVLLWHHNLHPQHGMISRLKVGLSKAHH
jgi:hypothetical protein